MAARASRFCAAGEACAITHRVFHLTTTFADLGLSELILRAVTGEGYTTPTPIQAQSIPHVLAGKDVLGCAQTGTGKTAAFSLPILNNLSKVDAGAVHPHPNQHKHRPVRALVLSPTRELALQIDESMKTYGKHTHLRTVCVFGGVSQHPQTRALKQGVDILVATPGRLIDLMDQGFVDLSKVEVFVLDEADRMLDMGFIEPIRRIAGEVPEKRQTLLFSATMPKEIRKLADSLLNDPVSVQVAAVSSTPDRVKQQVVFVGQNNKAALLVDMLRKVHVDRCLVFTRTKHGADRVAKHLNHSGIPADAIHGNKRQNVRQRSLEAFKNGRTHVLVATDIAARGIDVDGISHVVNFDLPNEPETYVHRIGRTARAGASGEAVSFVDRSSDERHYLREIQKLTKREIPSRDARPPEEMATEMERPMRRGATPPPSPEAMPTEQPTRKERGQRDEGFEGRPERRPAHRSEQRSEFRSEARPKPRFDDREQRPARGERPERRFDDRREGFRNEGRPRSFEKTHGAFGSRGTGGSGGPEGSREMKPMPGQEPPKRKQHRKGQGKTGPEGASAGAGRPAFGPREERGQFAQGGKPQGRAQGHAQGGHRAGGPGARSEGGQGWQGGGKKRFGGPKKFGKPGKTQRPH